MRASPLSMNRSPSSHPSPPVGEKVPGGRLRGIPIGSWLRFTSEFWRCPLSMNRVPSGGFGLENQVVFASQFLQQTVFGLGNFLFVFLESLFHVADPLNHQTPEQFGQLARQRQIGDQPALATLEPSIE